MLSAARDGAAHGAENAATLAIQRATRTFIDTDLGGFALVGLSVGTNFEVCPILVCRPFFHGTEALHRMYTRVILLQLACCAAPAASLAIAPPASVTVFGPGSLEMRLIAAKLMSRAGYRTTLVAEAGPEDKWRRLMYGAARDLAAFDGAAAQAELAAKAEAIGDGLARAEALCLICDTAPVAAAALKSALDAAPELKRLVLLSGMGVTRAKGGGLFGMGGGGKAQLEGEVALRAAAAERDLELSIVRVGTLKGGGPGAVEGGELVGPVELGLAKPYYDGILELETAMTTQAYDKFTLGAEVRLGDPVDSPNVMMAMALKGSFDPREDETSRVVAGGALVQALRHGAAVELSVGSAKGTAPPDEAEWARLFEKLE